MKLDINFISQQGNSYRNDCGPACVAMVTGAPISKVLAAANHPLNKQMHIQDIMRALLGFRLKREFVRPLHLPDARRWLANGNPIVALIGYGRLPAAERARDYDGNHYVLVVGYTADGGFFVHDPLWPDQAGAYRRWEDAVLGEAWANPVEALPLQGVVVQQPFAIAQPEMGELGLAVTTALNHGVAMGYLEQIYQALDVAPGRLDGRQANALTKIAQLKK